MHEGNAACRWRQQQLWHHLHAEQSRRKKEQTAPALSAMHNEIA
jgi:hypothetical protein